MSSEEVSDSDGDANFKMHQEERNFLCFVKLFFGVGLQRLRNLFMEIHPKWTNQPSDAAALDKGRMILDGNEELDFNKGDINQWDFSLTTTVLLYSKKCSTEIWKKRGRKKRSRGSALRELKKIRCEMLAHPRTYKMSNKDFNTSWAESRCHFVALGAHPSEIDEIKYQSDEVLLAGGYYKGLYSAENERLRSVENKIDELDSKINTLIEINRQSRDAASKEPLSSKDLSGQKWDEWLKFCDAVGDFDSKKNQYILITDALTQENLDCFSVLRSIPWKIVLDFDLLSEKKGMYREFTSEEGRSNLVSVVTPEELESLSPADLAGQIDRSKTQWMFMNGRSSYDGDTEQVQEFPKWEATSLKQISKFFLCYCDTDKFDKLKPVVCLVLPICQKSVPHFEVTLSRLFENVSGHIVSFRQQKQLAVFGKVKARSVDLGLDLVSRGLKNMFCVSPQTYAVPTSQAGIYYDLSEEDYLYLKEHFEILYQGCEELPVSDNTPDGDLKKQNFLEEQRRSFISGNQISFASLYYNHDAKREIANEIRIHVQRLVDKKLTRPLIVGIKHSPGTGGTTIARRVMWDLHKDYPCAFNSTIPFEEDTNYAKELAMRIALLEEVCQTPPIILIDGKQSEAIEILSNKLVMILGKEERRALLLCCQHGSQTSSSEIPKGLHVHKVFYVGVKLEDSYADLNEFKNKYNEFVKESLHRTGVSKLCRVFHFPLFAKMQAFAPKLKKIIEDTWNEMESLQKEIAILVAFIQLSVGKPTPASVLSSALKTAACEDITQLFTEPLLNLMVPANLFRRQGSSPEFTFQYQSVAQMLLQKAYNDEDIDLVQIVNKLQLPICRREQIRDILNM